MVARPGQTLVEVLIALGVILVGILSLTSALVNSQITATVSVEEVLALQLAREPLEAARFIRDSNWLQRENGYDVLFNEGLQSPNPADLDDYTAVYTWDPDPAETNLDKVIQFDFTPDAPTDPLTAVRLSADNFYQAASGEPTGFSRLVTFYPICSTDDGVTELFVTADGENCTDLSADHIGVQVISTVNWLSRNTPYSVTLEDRLYNWRYAAS